MAIIRESIELFSDKELASADTGEYVLADGFEEKLAELRQLFGRPMPVTSGARTKAHNKAVGGHPRSLHVYDYPYWPTGGCAAVDVATQDGEYRHELMKIALQLEWSVGVAGTFLHLDRRVDYTPRAPAVFTY